MTTPARTIFLGSGSFAVPVVDALARHPAADLLAVVTAPARAGNRGRLTDPPVAEWADDNRIPMLRPPRLRSDEAVDAVRSLRPDLLVLADYGQIVPQSLIDLPAHGALNLHPSLLPRHRGASPIPAAIIAGDEETGVSLMLMDAGIDTGAVLAQSRHALRGSETAPRLEADLATQAAQLLADNLQLWLVGELTPSVQPNEGATVTPLLRRADGRLDPALAAATLERHVRAYQPWPGTFVDTDAGRLVVHVARPIGDAPVEPGTLVATDGGELGLATARGVLELVEVQPAGGRRMSGADLVRGRPTLIGSRVSDGTETGNARTPAVGGGGPPTAKGGLRR